MNYKSLMTIAEAASTLGLTSRALLQRILRAARKDGDGKRADLAAGVYATQGAFLKRWTVYVPARLRRATGGAAGARETGGGK